MFVFVFVCVCRRGGINEINKVLNMVSRKKESERERKIAENKKLEKWEFVESSSLIRVERSLAVWVNRSCC